MRIMDMNDGKTYTLPELKKEWNLFRSEEPWNHADNFKTELVEIILATVNGRNDMEIIDMTPAEVSRYCLNLHPVRTGHKNEERENDCI